MEIMDLIQELIEAHGRHGNIDVGIQRRECRTGELYFEDNIDVMTSAAFPGKLVLL